MKSISIISIILFLFFVSCRQEDDLISESMPNAEPVNSIIKKDSSSTKRFKLPPVDADGYYLPPNCEDYANHPDSIQGVWLGMMYSEITNIKTEKGVECVNYTNYYKNYYKNINFCDDTLLITSDSLISYGPFIYAKEIRGDSKLNSFKLKIERDTIWIFVNHPSVQRWRYYHGRVERVQNDTLIFKYRRQLNWAEKDPDEKIYGDLYVYYKRCR